MADQPAHELLRAVARDLEESSPRAELIELRVTIRDTERTWTIRRLGRPRRTT